MQLYHLDSVVCGVYLSFAYLRYSYEINNFK